MLSRGYSNARLHRHSRPEPRHNALEKGKGHLDPPANLRLVKSLQRSTGRNRFRGTIDVAE